MAAAATAEASGARQPGLDLLRAVAIAWVLIYHAAVFDLLSPTPVVRFGWMGVDLFFALSGFLIAGQLFRPIAQGEAPDWRRFFLRRWMRTLPAYWAVLAVYALLPAARDQTTMLPLWRFLTFSNNLRAAATPPGAFSHVWSLCVEEQFYLLLPLALVLLGRRPRPAVALGLLATLVLAGAGLRGWLWLYQVVGPPLDLAAHPRADRYMTLIYYPTWTRLDDLLAGVGLAALRTFRPGIWAALVARANLLLALGVAGVFAAALGFKGQFPDFIPAVLGYPLLALALGLVVVGASAPQSVAARLAGPPARALAAGAYSLYLSHKLIYHLADLGHQAHPGAPLGLWLGLALAGAAVLGAALYWGVERPFLKLRDRLDVARADRGLAPAAAE